LRWWIQDQAASAGERYWEPQLLRLRARIARSGGEPDGVAAGYLERAVGTAKAMGAHMLETLALVDLLELSAGRGTERLGDLLGVLETELPAEAAARIERIGLDAGRGTVSTSGGRRLGGTSQTALATLEHDAEEDEDVVVHSCEPAGRREP
jgi:hypothetical protein